MYMWNYFGRIEGIDQAKSIPCIRRSCYQKIWDRLATAVSPADSARIQTAEACTGFHRPSAKCCHTTDRQPTLESRCRRNWNQRSREYRLRWPLPPLTSPPVHALRVNFVLLLVLEFKDTERKIKAQQQKLFALCLHQGPQHRREYPLVRSGGGGTDE